LVISPIISCIGYLLMTLRWRGHTNAYESLYVILGEFGTAMTQSAAFVGLTAGIESDQVPIAATGLFQSQFLGVVVGLGLTSALIQGTLRPLLEDSLKGFENGSQIVERAISDIDFVQSLTGGLKEVVVNCYTRSLMYTYGECGLTRFAFPLPRHN
jgi:hypothetical protein